MSLSDNGTVTNGPFKDKILIQKRTGAPSQPATSFVNVSEQADKNFRGRGITYLYVRYNYDQEVFAGGLPLVTVLVRGKKVFDPRNGTTSWSKNAALCIRDYITSEYGLNDDQIDDVSFSVAANICDENVSLSGGGTEKRYTINGVANASQSHGDVLQSMLTACAGTLFWGAGKWKLVVADYVAPTKYLDLSDLRGPINLSTRIGLQDQFNGVQGTFNDAENRWLVSDYPPVKSSVFQAQDNGEETLLDFPLPFTTSAATAQRIAKLALFKGREQMTLTADFGLNAFDVEVGEIIAFSNPRYGWVNKEFEVIGWSFGSAEAGDLRVTLTLRETSEAAYDWNAEEKEIIANDSNLPTAFDTPEVGLSVDAGLRVNNEQVVGVLLIDVTSESPFLDRFEVQYRRSGQTNWTSLGQASGNKFEAVGISDGLFDIRARSITALGVRGPFNTISGFYATLFETPPETVTNFSANVVGNTLHLSWTPVGDLDLSHYKIRYSNKTSGANYQNSVDLVKKIPRPGNTATVPAQTGTYFIKAVDKLGITSTEPASIVIDTNVADLDNLNFVARIEEDPNFLGDRNGTALGQDDQGFYLTLDTDPAFDSSLGLFDDSLGLFDGGSGGVVSSGTYQFDGYLDLGETYISRVTTILDVDFLDYTNSFDSASDLFDSREGLFDGDTSAFDTTSAGVQVSTTNDDPSGTPTWTDWRDFIVGDIAARALRFRAILESSSAYNAPAIRELAVEIDMPDRLESEQDITYTGTRVITFPHAFNVTPALGIAATLANGDRYEISSKSRTGFTITTYTGGSISTNPTTIDYVAKGYGKELAT